MHLNAGNINGTAISAPNGAELNRLAPEDRGVHDWYRFNLSFPPHLVRQYAAKFGLSPEKVLLDPFAGTGTTLAEAKKLGIASIGIEAHPFSHFAGVVKTDWTPDPDEMLEAAEKIAEEAQTKLLACGILDGVDAGRFAQRTWLRRFDAASTKLLLTNSISPVPLHKTLVLRDAIRRRSACAFHRHHLLALARCAVNTASNLHFGPEVGVTRTFKNDAPVVSAWLEIVRMMAADLRAAGANRHIRADVIRGDSRETAGLVPAHCVDAVITSPPYPNEKDYTRTTRLETVLLGFICNKTELQSLKKGLMRSNTRNVYRDDADDLYLGQSHEVHRLADAIEARRVALNKTSGFERMYHRVTRLYFGGMARHFATMSKTLRPGAKLAYVVGDQASYLRVMIRTGNLLADIAASQGYTVDGIELFRTRYASATREQLNEEVVLLTWPG